MVALLLSVGVLLIAGAILGKLAHVTERSTMIGIIVIGTLIALASLLFIGR